MTSDEALKHTPLHALHMELRARTTVRRLRHAAAIPPGVLKEHLLTRAGAGLFDVSHMGQIVIRAKSGDVRDAARALERLVPVDISIYPRGGCAMLSSRMRMVAFSMI